MADIITILWSQSFLPIFLLVAFGLAVLLCGLYNILPRLHYLLAMVGVGVSLLAVVLSWGGVVDVPLLAHHGLVVFGMGLVLAIGLVVLQLSGRFWQTTFLVMGHGRQRRTMPLFSFEVAALMLFAMAGLLVMVAAKSFVSLYLGLELSSLSAYFLVNINRHDPRASEASLKYYILGSMASAIFLFGVSLLYGMTGTLDLAPMAQKFSSLMAESSGAMVFSLALGLLFIIVGLGFKVAAAPFHFWSPDVYQGSLSPITGFFATAPKLAAVIILARLLLEYFSSAAVAWQGIVAVLAVLSLLFGAFPALTQNNLKRFIALAGVSHIGFLLLAILAMPQQPTAWVYLLGYVGTYATQTIGLLAVLLVVIKVKGRDDEGDPDIGLSDFVGLAHYRPDIAFGLLILLFSLAGIPPLLGFFAKWWVLLALVKAGYNMMAVMMVVMSVVTATYYLKIVKTIYMDKAPTDGRLGLRQIYDGQKNIAIMFWFWLVVMVQVVAPLLLGRVMALLSQFQPQ